MAATDFTAVTVTYDDATGIGTLSGLAHGDIVDAVHITETIEAENGDTETNVTDGTRTRTRDLSVKVTAVVDDLGGTYTIAADGQSYQLNP